VGNNPRFEAYNALLDGPPASTLASARCAPADAFPSAHPGRAWLSFRDYQPRLELPNNDSLVLARGLPERLCQISCSDLRSARRRLAMVAPGNAGRAGRPRSTLTVGHHSSTHPTRPNSWLAYTRSGRISCGLRTVWPPRAPRCSKRSKAAQCPHLQHRHQRRFLLPPRRARPNTPDLACGLAATPLMFVVILVRRASNNSHGPIARIHFRWCQEYGVHCQTRYAATSRLRSALIDIRWA